MVNLIAGRKVVPELIQNDFTPDQVALETLRLLRDRSAAAAMRAELAEVRSKLGPPGAVERAAEAITALLTGSSGNASSPAAIL
jgi:lipid-A-disaccharide synthase